MDKIVRLVREKQLFCFFVLAFLISWVIWILSPVITPDTDVQKIINLIGAFGPAIAAVIISGTIGLNTQAVPTLRYWWVFGLSFFVVFTLIVLSMDILQIPHKTAIYILFGIISFISSIILTGPLSKNRGIRRLLRYIKKANVNYLWHIIVIFFIPLLTLISLSIDLLLGGSVEPGFYSEPWYMFTGNSILVFFALTIFGGSLNEEPGWRGFALPRLLLKFNPIVASIILGFIWSLWHAPLHFNGFYQAGFAAFLTRFLWNIPLTIFFTWLYMKTKGSLLHVTLLHTSINTVGMFIPVTQRSGIILVIIALILLITIIIQNKMWIKREHLGPYKNV